MHLKQKHFPFEYLTILWFVVQLFPFYNLPIIPTISIFLLIMGLKYYFEAFRFNYAFFFIFQALLIWSSSVYLDIAIIFLSLFLIDIFPAYEYPDPTGPYKVGYKSFTQGKDIDVAIFYPTKEWDPSRNEHLDSSAQISIRNYNGFKLIFGHYIPPLIWLIPKFLIDLAHTFYKRLFMNVTRNAEIIPKSPNQGFPVIVFSHGLGAFKHLFSVYCKEWASHGYIVFSVDYDEQIYYKWKEYSDFVAVRLPQLEVRRTTVRKVLDYIHNEKYIQELFGHKVKLDYNKVFLAGHSFGSATSATLVTAYEREIAGVILLDPWLDPCNEELFTKPLQKPMLLLRSEHFAKMKPIYEKVERFIQANKEYIFSGYLKGTVHNDVTDFILTLPKNIKHALRLAKETDRKYREDKLMLHSGIVQIFTDTVCQEINRNEAGKDFPGDMREKVLEFLRKNRKEEEFHFDM